MSTAFPGDPIILPGEKVDRAVVLGRLRENIVVGDEIVRHRRSTRLMHWSVALTFLASMLSGMPIWTPFFAWMAPIVGGLQTARIIHPYAGVLFFIASVVLIVRWRTDMRIEEQDREWFGPKLIKFMRYEAEAIDKGKYNGGQKLFFWAVALGAVALLLSGIPMWFPESFPIIVRQFAILIHDVTFIFFVVGIIEHVYMGTAAEPGTFRSMVVGTVTRPWARLHHPGWYREVVGEKKKEA